MNLTCSECEYKNEIGALYCASCGASLAYDEHTPIFLRTSELQTAQDEAPSVGLGLYGAPATIDLLIEGYPELRVKLDDEATLGRQDANVDLTSYGAIEKGVSRLHAVIRSHGNVLTLTDLDSTNGTLLNGDVLATHRPRIIKSNDEIQLGGLVLRVQFD